MRCRSVGGYEKRGLRLIVEDTSSVGSKVVVIVLLHSKRGGIAGKLEVVCASRYFPPHCERRRL